MGVEYTDKRSNVFIRAMPFRLTGDVVDGHAHNFPHVTYCVRGAILLERLADDSDEVVGAITLRASNGMNWALIPAGVRHRITALEDDSLGHCIYAHRTPQGAVVQEYTGWGPAYG